jgi:hypothetical protein
MPPSLSRWIMPLPLAIAFVSPALAAPGDPPQSMATSEVSFFCYMVTTQGEIRDLTSLCGGNSQASAPPSVQTTKPCYFLDDDGKPCSVAGRPAFSN